MRTAVSMAGIGAALLAGACFDPTRPCSTNADCVNGGTCDPGTKTCVSAGNPNDKTPPIFSILVVPPSPRQNTPKLTELDPASPDGGVDAFRRDEAITVLVTSQDQDVDAGSVKLRVFGVATGPVTPVDAALVSCVPGSVAAAGPFCRQASVPLAPIPFDAFRGVVTLEASGSDLSNNLGTADAGVNVTRWKWRYSAGAPIYTTPAIADDGTIVFGTSDGGSGSLYALTPLGAERWPPLSLGPIEASVSISAGAGLSTLIYAATSSPGGAKISAVRLLDGSDAGVCLGGSGLGFSKPILGGLALVSTTGDNGPIESSVGLAGGTRLVTFRPSALGTTDPACLEAAAPFQQTRFETVASDGVALFLGAQDNSIRSFTFEPTSINWIKNPSWGLSGAVLVGDSEVSAIAIDGADLLLGVHPYGLVRVSRSNGSALALGPDGGVTGDPSGPSVAPNEVAFGAGTASIPRVYALNLATGAIVSGESVGLVRSVPSRGSDQVTYFLTTDGFIEARNGAPAAVWSARLSQAGGFQSSPTLGCIVENGSTIGVTYAGSDDGALTAVIVDSRGLDTSASWPKYQHDPRNTGNSTTPIQSCP